MLVLLEDISEAGPEWISPAGLVGLLLGQTNESEDIEDLFAYDDDVKVPGRSRESVVDDGNKPLNILLSLCLLLRLLMTMR